MDYKKVPYEIIEKKLELAELTIQLGEVTREKWRRLETMRDVLNQEEELLKKIAKMSAEISDVKR
jgi:hypothetical protein